MQKKSTPTLAQPTLDPIDGVSPSCLYFPKEAKNDRALFYLRSRFSHIDLDQWRRRFCDGLVFAKTAQGFIALDENAKCGDYMDCPIYYYRFVENEKPIPFAHYALFENARFLIADKPHFLPTTPGGQYARETLLSRLKAETNNADLSPAHRLDRQTAGLILFCKDKKYRGAYQQLFASKNLKKTYHAIAPFCADLPLPMQVSLYIQRADTFYTMQVVDKGNLYNSHTDISIMQVNKKRTWAKYRLLPITGKMHQLRAHLHFLGIPIKNDAYYPVIDHKADNDFSRPLQLLSKVLEFVDPIDKKSYRFVSEKELLLPED